MNASSTRLAIILALGAMLWWSGPATAESIEERVERAARATYFEGVTEEIAQAQVGPEGVPELLKLLADPTFPRRDNVVAFLLHLGDHETTRALLRHLSAPPAGVSVSEEDRAILLAPQALGHIARRGDALALDALLEMTADGSEGGRLGRAVAAGQYPNELREDLTEMALRGLASSNAPLARQRLQEIAEGRCRPLAFGRNLGVRAGAALQAMDVQASAASAAATEPLGGAPDATTSDVPTGAGAAAAASAGGPSVGDGFSDSIHLASITYTNHAAVLNPMTDARLESLMAVAQTRIREIDYSGDYGCCYQVGSGGTLGLDTAMAVGDGLDVIDDNTELNAVLNLLPWRAKVVRLINYCGGAAPNIIGCAWQPGYGMAVVRVTGLGTEAVIWAHELGHNMGLPHAADSRRIMYGIDNGANNGLSSGECATVHSPAASGQADLHDGGACLMGCANGFLDYGEQCDDGNTTPGDGCDADCIAQADVVVLPPKPVNATIPTGKVSVTKTLSIKVRNADEIEHTIALAVDASGCPSGLTGSPDFIPSTPAADSSILVPAHKMKTAKLPLTIRSADFASFNFKAPARCILVITATAVVAGGNNDPNPSNNVAAVELNIVDRNDAEQTATHETLVKSPKAITLNIPTGKTAATKTLRATMVNADYKPAAEVPGDAITLAASTTCAGLSLTVPVCDAQASSPTAIVKGGASRVCTLKATATGAQISTANPRAPQRCTVTLTATGPTPQAAPLDGSNNSTALTIDVLDKND